VDNIFPSLGIHLEPGKSISKVVSEVVGHSFRDRPELRDFSKSCRDIVIFRTERHDAHAVVPRVSGGIQH